MRIGAAWDAAWQRREEAWAEVEEYSPIHTAAEERLYAAIAKIDPRFSCEKRKIAIDAIGDEQGWPAINDHYDGLVDRASDIEFELLRIPAPDAEAMMRKVQRLYKVGDGMWADGIEDQTHADLRRFIVREEA